MRDREIVWFKCPRCGAIMEDWAPDLSGSREVSLYCGDCDVPMIKGTRKVKVSEGG